MVKLVKQNYLLNKISYYLTKLKLKKVIGTNIPINHVGSTAIPNMYGKNIIDILLGANTQKELNEITNKLKELNFYPGKNSTGEIYRFFASSEAETKAGDIHIHLVITNSDRYTDFLILKKYLLKNKTEKKAYSNLKKDLIKNGYTKREDYKSIKSKYVSELLNRAKITTK